MTNAIRAATLALILGGLLCVAGVGAGDVAAYSTSCGVKKAQQDVTAAKRAVAKANARLREARYVLSATKAATASYGTNVGRWVRLARRSGWSRGCISHLMYVIHRESRGSPKALNPSSGCAGLLQLHPCHGVKNPFDPGVNLRAGHRLYRAAGWSPWAL